MSIKSYTCRVGVDWNALSLMNVRKENRSVGARCHFRGVVWMGRHAPKKTCPLCNKGVQAESRVYLVINNGVLFPNIVAHAGCVDTYGFLTSAELMILNWNEYLQIKGKYAAWEGN